MENNKGQTIFLSVVGIATLLVAIVGATFAYFSINVTGNETASSIVVSTAIVGGVTFLDGQEIRIDEIYPGWSATKTFTVENTTAGATDEIKYAILLDVKTNTLTMTETADEFVYTLSGATTNSGTVVPTLTEEDVPAVGVNTLGTQGTLNGTDTHTYTFKIELKETGSAQDYAQGKAFAGVLQVELASGTGARTWDEANKTWKNY